MNNKRLHTALMLLAALCLYAAMPVYGQSSGADGDNPDQRFNIQMIGALNNDPKSQYNVAEMYEQGVGIPQDLGMAKMWYTKSANQGYDPAIKKLANWELEKKQAELEHQRRRAEEQKRRDADAKAAVARAEEQKRREAEARVKAAVAAKAAAARAEEQKRRDAEAKAKATAARAEEQKRRDAEAKAAAEHAAEQKRHDAEAAAAAKSAQPAEPAAVVKEKQVKVDQPKNSGKSTTAEKTDDKTPVFKANPCDTPTAKFTSTCQ